MSTQERRAISVRLDPALVAWADEYAAGMRAWTRTTVIEAALESFREDVAGGVPDAPLEEVPAGTGSPAPAPPRAAEDGGDGPSFRELDVSGKDFAGGHAAYVAWRSRRERWRRSL